ncbi:MAG: 23S rRNA (guanosine(2251)-2'-O)-methyltransferase RlmB [Tenuifilaceae bacterium]|jgi:23S rRNA (guanosine2251-2'-O)-methyltransferase|nr:23S rRNA (guanosine(2251)-2'-O)-methyltransferase RlmB [Tenuifilaceae bacterium]
MKQNTPDTIYGIRPLIEAINSGKEVDKVIIKKGLSGELVQELMALLRSRGIVPQYVPAEKFIQFGNRNHQGVVAYISPVDFEPIEEVVARLWEEGKTPFIVVLDSVTDVRNFGAIVRSAECAGAHAVVFPSKGSARIGADAVKTSAGAIHHMPICRVHSLKSTISFLQLSGIKVVAATEKASTLYTQSKLDGPVAIIMGSEDTGLSENAIKMADELVSIPIKGKVNSLNVSVAAGLILYEVVRQQGL